jgi:peptidyl-tRNA hydrolase, PTH1 family
MSRRLIVGLGNPGAKYLNNRHNIGFQVVDRLAEASGVALTRTKFNGVYGAGHLDGHSITLLKPQTFMNLSGRSVAPACRFFDIEPENILVIHDELDLDFGVIRLKVGGGHAGHNGLRSIHSDLGTNTYHRMRMGIGRPQKGSVSAFVLADFATGDERDFLPDMLDRGVSAIRTVLGEGTRAAMNSVNAS